MENPNPNPKPPRVSAPADAKEVFEATALLSHDVRSAVSDIIGALQLLDTTQMGDANKQHLARIGASASLLYRLIDQSESGSAVNLTGVQPHGFLLVNLLTTLRKRWSGRARDNRVDLVFLPDFEPTLTLDCDQLALERLLSNLLDNSIKFSGSGTVALSLRHQGETLLIGVQDDGPGFSASALDQLFTFGGRPEESTVSGSGLGLFICKKMAHQLNAGISARNTETGALVSVSLPCRTNPPQQIGIGPGWSGGTPKKHLKGVRILLAEDNKTNQLVASQMLAALGAEVTIANDGIEALAMVETQPFDLAVLDIEMPRKSGLELIRDIRSRKDAIAELPIVAVTAYVMQDHRRRILATGADGIIAKPLMNIDAFGRELLRIMQGRNEGASGAQPAIPERPRGKPARGQGVVPVDDYVFGSLYKTIGPEAFSDLLEKLQQDLGNVADRLQAALTARDCKQLGDASHILISLAGAVGAFELQDSAEMLNNAAHAGDFEKITRCGLQSLKLVQDLTFFLETPGGQRKAGMNV